MRRNGAINSAGFFLNQLFINSHLITSTTQHGPFWIRTENEEQSFLSLSFTAIFGLWGIKSEVKKNNSYSFRKYVSKTKITKITTRIYILYSRTSVSSPDTILWKPLFIRTYSLPHSFGFTFGISSFTLSRIVSLIQPNF